MKTCLLRISQAVGDVGMTTSSRMSSSTAPGCKQQYNKIGREGDAGMAASIRNKRRWT